MTMTMRAERPSKLTQRPLYALLAFPPGLAWLNCIIRGKHIYFQRPFKFQWSFTEEMFFFRYLLPSSASSYFHNMFGFKCQSQSQSQSLISILRLSADFSQLSRFSSFLFAFCQQCMYICTVHFTWVHMFFFGILCNYD